MGVFRIRQGCRGWQKDSSQRGLLLVPQSERGCRQHFRAVLSDANPGGQGQRHAAGDSDRVIGATPASWDTRNVAERCTCGAQLPPDARFCHKCGKPQYDYPGLETEAVAQAPTPPPPPPPEISFRNGTAV